MIPVTYDCGQLEDKAGSLMDGPCDGRPFRQPFVPVLPPERGRSGAPRTGLEIASGGCKFIPVEPEKDFSLSSIFSSLFSPQWHNSENFPRSSFSGFASVSWQSRHSLSGKSNYTLLDLIPGGEGEGRKKGVSTYQPCHLASYTTVA